MSTDVVPFPRLIQPLRTGATFMVRRGKMVKTDLVDRCTKFTQ